GFASRFDEGVGARGADFDRLFREDMEAMAGRGDALGGMEAGRAADDDEIHGAMIEEGVEVLIGRTAMFAGEAGDLVGGGSVDGRDFDARDRAGGASVGFRDVAAADQAGASRHVPCSVRYEGWKEF